MSPDAPALIEALALHALAAHDRPVVIGVCGAQGSGKSTAATAAAWRLEARGVATAILSLDDLYLSRAERQRLAAQVHPLLRTRGVPGTHDVALGIAVLDAIRGGRPVALPRFDKALDDCIPEQGWPLAPAGCRVLLFEGWCVGARPQTDATLGEPVNDLEAREDPDGHWRRFVNAALAGDYQELFARVDRLLLLAAPGFGVVHGWRAEQELALHGDGRGGMDAAQIARFIGHYERLTRHILHEMPGRADMVAQLDEQRRILATDISIERSDLSI